MLLLEEAAPAALDFRPGLEECDGVLKVFESKVVKKRLAKKASGLVQTYGSKAFLSLIMSGKVNELSLILQKPLHKCLCRNLFIIM